MNKKELVKRLDDMMETWGANLAPSTKRTITDAIAYINSTPSRDEALDAAWAGVNVLGAPDTACITDRDRAYCQAIGDALSAIKALKSAPNAKEAPGEHKIVAGLKEAVAYAQGDRLHGRETKMVVEDNREVIRGTVGRE